MSEDNPERTLLAKVVLHSINSHGEEILTLVLRMPKFLMAELSTHRSLSKNSASSRAIPHDRFRSNVENDPFIPEFTKHQSGMTSNTPVDERTQKTARRIWKNAMQDMLAVHRALSNLGVSKGQANRVLEPFFWTEVIVTGTRPAWEAFLALRANPEAMKEFQEVAYDVKQAIEESEPEKQELHLPFSDPSEDTTVRVIQSVVNCARVSYLNHEGTKDAFEKLQKRFIDLIEKKHASPFEHQAATISSSKVKAQYSANFANFSDTSWGQLRKVIEIDGIEKVEKVFKGFKTPSVLKKEDPEFDLGPPESENKE